MSTRDIIYDRRFKNGTFDGYKVAVSKEQYSSMCTTQIHLWNEVEYLKKEIRDWLDSQGPWEQSSSTWQPVGASFRFARESTAVMFKLRYC